MLQPHIKVETDDKVCLIRGNPDCVPIIASFLTNPNKVTDHRGLVSYKGTIPNNNIPVTVVTTGMGCPITTIVLEECYNAKQQQRFHAYRISKLACE